MEGKRDSFFLKNKTNKHEKEKPKQDLGLKQEFKQKRLNNFNKNRVGPENNNGDSNKNPEKKPFDKKTYRLKKYSKKYKLEQWEEQRKKKLLREYHKSVKNEEAQGSYKPIGFDEDTTDANQVVGKFVRHPDLIERESSSVKKMVPFLKAKDRYNKIKQDKFEKQQEVERVKEEKRKKLQEYKKKKQERFKKLSKKTKKGQPVMTGRLELLLEKIQKK